MSADLQTLSDLEFDTIRSWAIAYAKQPTAEERLSKLQPIPNFGEIQYQLDKTFEFQQIRITGETFPQLEFEELENEIRLIQIGRAHV